MSVYGIDERLWFAVGVGPLDLVVKAHDPEAARLKVEYYDQASPRLGVDAEAVLASCLLVELLDDSGQAYFDVVDASQPSPVRLVADRRPIAEEAPANGLTPPVDKHQLGLFTLKTF